jgi:hypothetical protein
MSGLGQKNPAGVWRSYSGVNPHTAHIHVSIRHPEYIFDSMKSWGWVDKKTEQSPKGAGPATAKQAEQAKQASPVEKTV